MSQYNYHMLARPAIWSARCLDCAWSFVGKGRKRIAASDALRCRANARHHGAQHYHRVEICSIRRFNPTGRNHRAAKWKAPTKSEERHERRG